MTTDDQKLDLDDVARIDQKRDDDCNDSDPPVRDFKASNIANKAAQDAKEALEAQQVAGAQASQQVKAQLAEKASQAAEAADAALQGKQQMVSKLHHELKEALSVLEEEASSYKQTQSNLQASLAATSQASQLLKSLSYTMQIAQNNVINSEKAADGAQRELAEKTALVDAAQTRVEHLRKEVTLALQDLAAVKQAAVKAEEAARNAENAAQRNRRNGKFHPKRRRRRRKMLRSEYLAESDQHYD